MIKAVVSKLSRIPVLILGVLLLLISLSACSTYLPKKFLAQEDVHVNELWTAQVGYGVGKLYTRLPPAITEKVIYASDSEGTVLALDRADGHVLWKNLLNTPIVGGVYAGYGLVLLGSSEGELLALDQNTGQEKWRVTLSSEIPAPPQFNGQWIVAQTSDGSLFALDGATGKQKWVYKTSVPLLSLKGTSTPMIVGDKVFAGFATGKFVALSLSTGIPLWELAVSLPQGRSELERIVDIDGRFIVEGEVAYVSAYQGKVLAIQISSGQVMWKSEQSTHVGLESALSNLYITNSEGVILALDQSNGQEVWQQEELKSRKVTLPVKMGQNIVVADQEGYLYWLSQIDGRIVATHRIQGLSDRANPVSKNKALYTPIVREAGNGIRTPVVVKDDTLYLLTNHGVLKALTLTEKR